MVFAQKFEAYDSKGTVVAGDKRREVCLYRYSPLVSSC